MDGLMAEDKDKDRILIEAKEAYERCKDADSHNHLTSLGDLKFSKLQEQWPEKIKSQREAENRPVLTIDKTQAFIRQVVNDSRQNKPQIKVRPVDSGADRETADIIAGLIKNIEYTSNADIAYDTAIESAVAGGFGYFRVGMDYAFDDSFDMDLSIERVLNPHSVYGDPHSTSADGSDWNVAFIIDRMPKEEFKRRFKDKMQVSFDDDSWNQAGDWLDDDTVMVAEYWTREEVEREIVKLNDGRIFSKEQIETDPDIALGIELGALQVVSSRMSKTHKVTQVIMSGVEVLETNPWPGRYIPIIPVYGDEFAIEGKRYFRSLIHPAKDAQMMFNFWRTNSTELVALAPRVPYIGPKGAFDHDQERWQTANTKSHSYLEYTGGIPPQRQPLDMGVAAGSLQEALNASDDMKAIIGMYDASLGARSNETSGKAIMARQREGDISTFHFIDNLSRAIRQLGRILIDLIPHVYSAERVIRVIGDDGKEKSVQINQPGPKMDEKGKPVVDEQGQAIIALHDLTTGKYDLTVEAGPSFTTRREEAAAQMTEMIRALPQAAAILGGPLVKSMDWPGAQEIAEKLEKLDPTNQPQIPPQVKEGIQKMQSRMAELETENQQLKAKTEIDTYEAQTKRQKVVGDQQIDKARFGVDLMEKLVQPPQGQPEQAM
jgi:hypothetical protein